jgi:GT2 family glycosyltransferase
MSTGITLDILARGAVDAPLLSVIIPLAPAEPVPEALMATLPPDIEILLARGGTRASSMNHAAARARGRNLWFIHADTQLPPGTCARLLAALETEGDALRYFDLRFDQGGAMYMTALGVRFRSQILGMPFGDQALCLAAASFRALGGYDESLPSGEDHHLVWRARQAGIPLRSVGASVVTSARKYREQGWWHTTLVHLRMTVLQAWPEVVIWLGKSGRRVIRRH